jgi:outer membrane protein
MNRRTPPVVPWLLAAALGFGSAWAAPEPGKVGVFDAQLVSESTDVGKNIQKELTRFSERKEAEISGKQKQVADLRQQLSQQSLSLSPDKRTAMEKDIQRQMLELQSLQESANRELELEYGTATKNFRDKLIVAIESFGRDEGFALILDRSQVAWAASAVDVTSAVIDRFNKMFPMEAAAAPSADKGQE